MATLPNRYLPVPPGNPLKGSPFLGQGGGRADVILGLLNQGPPQQSGPIQAGPHPVRAPGPGSYNPGGGGIGGIHQGGGGMGMMRGIQGGGGDGVGGIHAGFPQHQPFQNMLHSGGRFQDMMGGINQQQLNHMEHGMAPGGFNGDFSHMSPDFLERLAEMLRPQGPEGTPGAGMFRLPQAPGRHEHPQQPRAHSFRQALIQRALGQVQR